MNFLTQILAYLGVFQTVCAEGSATSLDTFLSGGGSMVDFLVTNIPKIVDVIMSNGLLAVGFYILLSSLVIGVILRIAGSR